MPDRCLKVELAVENVWTTGLKAEKVKNTRVDQS
jgi:hypothetical protein